MYYHIAAGFICGQEEEDPVFYNLATQVGKIGVSCLLKIGCYVSQRSLCFFQAVLGQDGWCMPWREMRSSCVFHWLILSSVVLCVFMIILVKAMEEMANNQPSWTCLVNKNAHCNIYLLHIKDALILLKFLLIHVLLSTWILYYQTLIFLQCLSSLLLWH